MIPTNQPIEKPKNNPYIISNSTNIWTLFPIYIIYAFISSFLVFLTSTGWSALILPFISIAFYIIIGVIMVAIVLIKKFVSKTKITIVKIPKKFILLVVAFQALVYLSMPGDCGDFICDFSNIFVYRIFDYFGIAHTIFISIFISIVQSLSGIFLATYIIGLSASLFHIIFNGKVIKIAKYIIIFIMLLGVPILIGLTKNIIETKSLEYKFSKLDPSICALIDTFDARYKCYENIIKETKDIEICDQIPDFNSSNVNYPEQMRDICYTYYPDNAKQPTPPEYCEKITLQQDYNRCLVRTAPAYKDQTICDKVKDDNYNSRDKCYLGVAEKTMQSDICSKIQSPDFSVLCYKRVVPINKNENNNQIDGWSTFRNNTYKYTIQYPDERKLLSNDFGVDAVQAQWVALGSFNIKKYEREYNLRQYPEVSFELDEYANLVWEYNKNDTNSNIDDKIVGELIKTTIDKKIAYQFTLTGSYVSYNGGYIINGEYLYTLISFDGAIYEIWFPTSNPENLQMLSTFSFIE
ncbi:hypothetical protein GW933_04030 [Candidatus Falkowbacteria bacterium]|uniref:Uncharacterized protein n=1 Tax=Candidatus Buchananbacteria bacterium CG10_big_fil_rev_8_21_14_0_10_33_19 TaxID=1974525 RepID=A0A2H0W546_9BACT|nr:hypothetical protein [Candidatus Falkowbacteria bacterium]PIS06492.1 MAG: hypothetical protein COT80_00965 [Candidatus Buchananbacteria bacterium CG10_big_fil_rev_8_21_14_0_10_33_19]